MGRRRLGVRALVDLAQLLPGFTLGIEGGTLALTKVADRGGIPSEELLVRRERELPRLDLQLQAARGEVGAKLEQLLGLHGVPADSVEEAKQPGRSGLKRATRAVPPPD